MASEAQQRQIAQAVAAERGEATTEAASSGTVKVTVHKDYRSPRHEYDFGKKHGFTQDYEFNTANGFEQQLGADDAQTLRDSGDPRFVIAKD